MSDGDAGHELPDQGDAAPGDGRVTRGVLSYVIGLALAALLTLASFMLPATGLVYGPSLPVALAALAIAQMGIHLVFFLNLTTAPDNTNNALALAFGIFIVFLLVGGSIWIMGHLNANMMPAAHSMRVEGTAQRSELQVR